MLPVYTRFLTPADYGILQLLSMVTDVAAILFTAGMSSGVQRFFFKAETVCEVSYADKGGKYQDQVGLTLPKVD